MNEFEIMSQSSKNAGIRLLGNFYSGFTTQEAISLNAVDRREV
jgi:hypothetical protein